MPKYVSVDASTLIQSDIRNGEPSRVIGHTRPLRVSLTTISASYTAPYCPSLHIFELERERERETVKIDSDLLEAESGFIRSDPIERCLLACGVGPPEVSVWATTDRTIAFRTGRDIGRGRPLTGILAGREIS